VSVSCTKFFVSFLSFGLCASTETDDEGPVLLAGLAKAASSSATDKRHPSGADRVASLHHAGLFLEASLVRSDTGAPVAKCLDGNSMARFERSSWNGGVLTATFKKLKILSTSQQLQVAQPCSLYIYPACDRPRAHQHVHGIDGL
jgi:hypothetical protein